MNKVKTRILVGGLVALGLGFFALQSITSHINHLDDPERELHPSRFESPWETVHRLRKESEPAMLKECTNYIGFTRLIDHRLDNYDDQVTNWTGSATIDFLNHFGGVDRTNLYFRFYPAEHCMVFEDDIKMSDQWAEAYKAEFARAHPDH